MGVWNILIFLSRNHLGTTTAYAQTTGYITQFFSNTLIPVATWTAGTCGATGILAAGGFIMLIGSRLAGECTSSHIISGMSQMAVSGLLFGAAVFASGIPAAKLLYRRSGR